MGTTRSCNPLRIQTAPGIPHVTADDGWTVHPTATLRQLVLGHGVRLSAASLGMTWDQQVIAGTAGVVYPVALFPTAGQVVRIQERTSPPPNAVWTTRFLGVSTAISRQPDGRVATINVTDVMMVFGRIYLGRGWDLASDGTVVDPGFLPPFNSLPTTGSAVPADRSVSVFQHQYSQSYVHDRSGSGVPWTVRDILELLLREGIHATLPGSRVARGLEWDLGNFPARVPATPVNLDLNGKTVLDALALLLPASQGFSWRSRIRNDGILVLDVIDLTVAGSPRALTTVWEQGLVYQEDLEGFDYLLMQGEQATYIVTLYYQPGDANSSIIPLGWTNDSATEANLWANDPGVPYTGAAWRRWQLNPTWNGSSYGAAGQPLAAYERDTVPNADEHYVPPTGGAYVMPAPRSLVLESTLPDGEGFTGSSTGPRQKSLIYAGPAGTPYNISDRVTVQALAPVPGADGGEPASIILGGTSLNAAAEVAALVGRSDTINGRLLVTIAVRHPRPLAAGYLRPRSAWPFGNPRVRVVKVPGIHLHIRWGNVTGGPLGGATLRDDTPRLRELRDQVAARFANPRARASWTERCKIVSDLLPGDVVSAVTLPTPTTTAGGPTSLTVGAPVTTVTIQPGEAGWDSTIDIVPLVAP